MAAPRRIVIVGASLAGLRAAQALRDEGFDGELTIVGSEPHWPYDRPPLSKQVLLGEWNLEKTRLEEPAGLQELGEWRLGLRASGLDARGRRLLLEDGGSLPFDRLLVATGSEPIRLPGQERYRGVHCLRTLEDAAAIAEGLSRATRVVVVGGGFIGAEVASAAVRRGLAVTVLEALPRLLERAVPPVVGDAFARLHRAHGVEVRTNAAVHGFAGAGHVEAVVLEGDERVPADLVVVGIGARPATEWLEGSGVALDRGVLCDERLQTNVPGVFAAGDVARWPNPLFGETMRIEHWTNAVEQGMAAARNMLAEDGGEPFAPVPYVWTDQHGISVRFAGVVAPGDDFTVLDGDLDGLAFTGVVSRGGIVRAVVTFASPMRHLRRLQPLVERGATLAEAQEVAL